MTQQNSTLRDYLQTIPAPLLAEVACGRVDIARLVRAELADRGLDVAGNWVGFGEAERLSAASR